MEITNELLAAYAEGNISETERKAVRKYLADHPGQLESVMMMMDEDYDIQLEDHQSADPSQDFEAVLNTLLSDVDKIELESVSPKSFLPMKAMAAQNNVDNLCAIRCEGYALRKLGVDISDEVLLNQATAEDLIKPQGMALYNIGRLSGEYGLNVAHRYNCSLGEISQALSEGDVVLVVIDSEELKSKADSASSEEVYNPDHVVVITSISEKSVIIIDSSTSSNEDSYSIQQFVHAWDDSSNYMIIISKNEKYDPHPIDLSDIPISDDLVELREAIAENAHEVWAFNRKKEGWSYGPFRDDEKKLHPDMIPYNRLPESEKEYDRDMAMNTIKLVQKLGWIIKRK